MKTISFVAIGQPSEVEINLFLRDLQSFFQMTNDYLVYLPKHWKFKAEYSQSLEVLKYDASTPFGRGLTPKEFNPDSKWTFFIDAKMSTPFVEVLKHLSLHKDSADCVYSDLRHQDSKIFGLTDNQRATTNFDEQLPLLSISTPALLKLLEQFFDELSKASAHIDSSELENKSFLKATDQPNQGITLKFPQKSSKNPSLCIFHRIFRRASMRATRGAATKSAGASNRDYIVFLNSLFRIVNEKDFNFVRPHTTWIYKG